MQGQRTTGQTGSDGMERARTAARDLTSAAAETATHKVEGIFETNKAAAVSGLTAVANALRSAASDMEGGFSGPAKRAADALETATHAIESRDLDALLAAGQDYARRQPTVFLGASFAAGFALARLLKASSTRGGNGSSHGGGYGAMGRGEGASSYGSVGDEPYGRTP